MLKIGESQRITSRKLGPGFQIKLVSALRNALKVVESGQRQTSAKFNVKITNLNLLLRKTEWYVRNRKYLICQYSKYHYEVPPMSRS
jgi:hypothetical protein